MLPKPVSAVLVVFVLTALMPAARVSAAEKVPPGSFLTSRASTVEELAAQVRKDSRVAQRYARHFRVEPAKVADYISAELRLVTLKRPLRVTVWFVAKDGSITSKPRVLPAGSMVFSNREGKPVFLWICGNPLRNDLPVPAPVEEPSPAPETAPSVIEELIPPDASMPSFLMQDLAPSGAISTLDAFISPPVPSMPPEPEKRRAPVWLLGLLFSGGTGGSGGSDENREPPVVVPEVPAGVLGAAGLPLAAGLAALHRRKVPR